MDAFGMNGVHLFPRLGVLVRHGRHERRLHDIPYYTLYYYLVRHGLHERRLHDIPYYTLYYYLVRHSCLLTPIQVPQRVREIEQRLLRRGIKSHRLAIVRNVRKCNTRFSLGFS